MPIKVTLTDGHKKICLPYLAANSLARATSPTAEAWSTVMMVSHVYGLHLLLFHSVNTCSKQSIGEYCLSSPSSTPFGTFRRFPTTLHLPGITAATSFSRVGRSGSIYRMGKDGGGGGREGWRREGGVEEGDGGVEEGEGERGGGGGGREGWRREGGVEEGDGGVEEGDGGVEEGDGGVEEGEGEKGGGGREGWRRGTEGWRRGRERGVEEGERGGGGREGWRRGRQRGMEEGGRKG